MIAAECSTTSLLGHEERAISEDVASSVDRSATTLLHLEEPVISEDVSWPMGRQGGLIR
jgi:hypothetical protein